ncbi:MAG: acetate--CoA ligase alpha subunit [Fidelibacterota bacterium]
MNHSLDAIFRPKSIAVIGASTRKKTIGREILRNLIQYEFNGKVFPVNPKADVIYSIKCYKNIREIEDPVDCAIIVVPKQFVLDVVDDCGDKGVKGLIVITAGFRETGEEGAKLEAALMERVRKYKMRMVGPNSMGVANTDFHIKMNATFSSVQPIPGNIGFISQSGALGEAILNHAYNLGIGISKFVSVGNKPDISGNDLLEYWKDDENVKIILMYLESFGDPVIFTKIAREISRKKPIIAVKAGRTSAGARATISHTGALAGVDVATDALFEQCGVIRVSSIEDMFDVSKAFLHQSIPKGNRIAIVTNAGGPGIMATDACVSLGCEVVELPDSTKRRLREVLPPEASVGNPVDMIATAKARQYRDTLEIMIEEDSVDAILVIFIPPIIVEAESVARTIAEVSKKSQKPVLTCFMGKEEKEAGVRILRDSGLPVYLFPESAAKAFSAMYRYRKWVERPEGKISKFKVNKTLVHDIIKETISASRKKLSDEETIEILKAYGIDVPSSELVYNVNEAVEAANKIGYPVVLKAESESITHKTDVGGVVVDLRNDLEVKGAFVEIRENLKKYKLLKYLKGITVQQMISGELETIIGMQQDPKFGPIVMFGLGGIYVEVLKDVSFRITPITDVDAREMLQSIKSYPLLTGMRGKKPVKLKSLIEAIQRVSQLVTDFFEIKEMDINPLIVEKDGSTCKAVDARIIVG